MNKDQKLMVLKEKRQLEDNLKLNSKLKIGGVILIVIAFFWGYSSGFIFLSIELILGFGLLIYGGTDDYRSNKRINEINFLLASNKAKKVDIKITRKIKKFFCSKCNEEVKESWNKCKKCKSFLAAEGAVKSKIVRE
jgi:RNase P subunit RPR2